MKKLKMFVLLFVLFVFSSLTLGSCSNSDESVVESGNLTEELTIDSNNVALSGDPTSFHPFIMTWTTWGRTSKNCDGNGLCNFEVVCWWCCTDANGNVVPCRSQSTSVNSAIGRIYDDTNTGYLTIKLDPIDSYHLNLITNRQSLFIDEDLENSDLVLLEGEYLFDENIGGYGGYEIAVRKI